MSPSKFDAQFELGVKIRELRDLLDKMVAEGQTYKINTNDLQGLLTSAVKLYSLAAEQSKSEIPPTDESISSTEALTLAAALLRAQNLTAFDFALWFSRTAPEMEEF